MHFRPRNSVFSLRLISESYFTLSPCWINLAPKVIIEKNLEICVLFTKYQLHVVDFSEKKSRPV